MADTKITGLTVNTTPISTDIVPVVIDPGGTPLNRKVTFGNIIQKAHGLSDGLVSVASGTMAGGANKVTKKALDEVGKTYTPATGAQGVAIDCQANNMHIVTGHVDGTAITFTISGATNSQCFIISILQGSGTVSTIAAWFATVRWAGGTPPTLTATLSKRDTFGFIRTGADTYDGFVIGQNA